MNEFNSQFVILFYYMSGRHGGMVSHIGIFQLIVYQCPYEILCMNEFNNQSVILFNYIRGGGDTGEMMPHNRFYQYSLSSIGH